MEREGPFVVITPEDKGSEEWKQHEAHQERMKILHSGGKIKCPRCANGYISALGDPKTAISFRCDSCPLGWNYRTTKIVEKMKEILDV